jgi:hypothetical protein
LRGLVGIAPENLGEGRITAPEYAFSGTTLCDRGSIGFDRPLRAGAGQSLIDAPHACELLQHHTRRERDFDLLAFSAFKRCGRAQPNAVHGLGIVVRAALAGRCVREEEACVESARSIRRRDLVIEVDEFAGRQQKRMALQYFSERRLASIERFAIGGQSGDSLRRQRLAGSIVRQEDSRLLEAFAGRGNPIGQPSRGQREKVAGLGIGQPDDARLDTLIGIRGLQRTAWEDVSPAQKCCIERAALHEKFRSIRRVAEQDQCCRGTNIQCWLARAAEAKRGNVTQSMSLKSIACIGCVSLLFEQKDAYPHSTSSQEHRP